MSRLAIVLLAAMAWAGTAVAQTQSTAPGAHAGTKLTFPASVGGAQLERSVNYAGPPSNRPDQGITYFYSTPKKMVIAVHVYDGWPAHPAGQQQPDGGRRIHGRARLVGTADQARRLHALRAAVGAVDLHLWQRRPSAASPTAPSTSRIRGSTPR
jgi:hypothetical protein